MAARGVTIRKIAKALNVSPTTVCDALNLGRGYVAPSTRAQVQRRARQMGYHQSLLRRAIKAPLRHLGVAVQSAQGLHRSYVSMIYEGVREEAAHRGYVPVVLDVPPQAAGVRADPASAVPRIRQMYESRLLDGMVLDKRNVLDVVVSQLYEAGIPMVLVNGHPNVRVREHMPVPSVVIDDERGARQAVRHLLELGHREIALMTLPYTRHPHAYRIYRETALVRGFAGALQEAGVSAPRELQVDADPADKSAVHAVVRTLLSMISRPTAIFAADDLLAALTIAALAPLGLSVPRDVSVVGYGDWSVLSHVLEPELTAVRAPLLDNGRLAASVLIDQIEGRKLTELHVALSPELIVRQSSAPPAK